VASQRGALTSLRRMRMGLERSRERTTAVGSEFVGVLGREEWRRRCMREMRVGV
jgi:hypothetical protein